MKVHRGGTYVCMEGPQFSTLAEAHTYRQLRFDVIGMTNLTEAKLAREAELCYATVAMITDYDCWHPAHASVTVSEIIANLKRNAENAQNVIREAVKHMPDARECKCGAALAHAILTDRKLIPAAAKKRLAPIAGKYLRNESGSVDVLTRGGIGGVRCDGNAVRQSGPHAGRRGELFRAGGQPFYAGATWWAWWAMISRSAMRPSSRPSHRCSRPRARAGQDFLLGGALQPEHERADDAGDGAERVRGVQSEIAGGVTAIRLRVSREHRSDVATFRAEADSRQAKAGGARHDELLDRANARGAARDAEAHARADDQ